MSTGISGSKIVFSTLTTASSLICGRGGGTSPSGVQAPWAAAGAAAVSASAAVLSSLTARLLRPVERRVQRVPGQRRALHAARELVHAGERRQALHLLREGR